MKCNPEFLMNWCLLSFKEENRKDARAQRGFFSLRLHGNQFFILSYLSPLGRLRGAPYFGIG